MAKPEKHVLVCMNSRPPGHPRGSCGSEGANEVLLSFQQEFETKNLFEKAIISGSSCLGPCNLGTMVVVYPDGTWYNKVTPKDVPEIIEKHIISGQPVDRLLLPEEAWS
ncbi:MAG: (2Fe-2S) ferredoxin domain-containing protein [Nitrospinota bacterium]|nr:(2Fe-2S) ferredoxin domain-containing protein [Nitrospinota bacterium]